MSGFPLEVRTASTCHDVGLDTVWSWAYPDPSTGKSREIDVVATKHAHAPPSIHPELGGSLTLHFLIECKRADGLVIFRSHPNEIIQDRHYFDSVYQGSPKHVWPGEERGVFGNRIPVSGWLEIGSLFWPWPDVVGAQYAFLSRRDKQRRNGGFKVADQGTYSRLQGLQAAVEALPTMRGSDVKIPSKEHWRPMDMNLVVPLVVVDAPIFSYDITSDSKTSPVNHAALSLTEWSSERWVQLRVDVVRESHLRQFLDATLNNFEELAARVMEHAGLFQRAQELEAEARRKQPASPADTKDAT